MRGLGEETSYEFPKNMDLEFQEFGKLQCRPAPVLLGQVEQTLLLRG